MLTARRLTPLVKRPQLPSQRPVPAQPLRQKVNPATGLLTFTGGGKFTISGRTGAYKGISGYGKVVLRIVGVLGRTKSGAGSGNGKPVAWQQACRGTARIKRKRGCRHDRRGPTRRHSAPGGLPVRAAASADLDPIPSLP
jgi:hypothetical protein